MCGSSWCFLALFLHFGHAFLLRRSRHWNFRQFWHPIGRFWDRMSVCMQCVMLFAFFVRNRFTIHVLAWYLSGHTLFLGNSTNVSINFNWTGSGGAETFADSSIILPICFRLIFLVYPPFRSIIAICTFSDKCDGSLIYKHCLMFMW